MGSSTSFLGGEQRFGRCLGFASFDCGRIRQLESAPRWAVSHIDCG
jgi:hypothetical protein